MSATGFNFPVSAMAVLRFTDRWLSAASLTPAAGRADYADELCRGLHVRVSFRGTRTFSVMHRMDGVLKRQTLGRYPRLGLAEARGRARELMSRAEVWGVLPSLPLAKPKPAGPSFGDLVDLYVEKHLKPNARSWKVVQGTLKSKYARRLDSRPVAAITRGEVRELIATIVAAGKPAAAISHLTRVNMLFNWAVNEELMDRNPSTGLRPPVKVTERDRVLSDAEIAAVWQGTEMLPSPIKQLYRMLMLTGQRRNEVATMRWSEVDGSLWTIPRQKLKSDRAHAVPLTRSAMDLLASLPRFGTDGYVFSTTGGVKACNGFSATKDKLATASGTSGWTIHDIRRTVRSKLAELGVSREVAERVVAHSTGRIERIYNRHEYLAEKREALERWETRLLEITSPSR